jgi:hypothetical protein
MISTTTPPRPPSLRRRVASFLALALVGLAFAAVGPACGSDSDAEPCEIGTAGCPCLPASKCLFELTCQPSFNRPGTMVCRPPGASATDPDGGVRGAGGSARARQ